MVLADGGGGYGDDRLGVSAVLMGRSGDEDRIGSEQVAGEVVGRRDGPDDRGGGGRGLQEDLVDGGDALCFCLFILYSFEGL